MNRDTCAHFVPASLPCEACADAARLDWLADPGNQIGNVQLPTECVLAHCESMRAAIDAAMRMEVTP